MQQAVAELGDTPADIAVWLDGRPLGFASASESKGEPRTTVVDLPEGASAILVRVPAGGKSNAQASLVTTLVADRPVGFNAAEAGASAGAVK